MAARIAREADTPQPSSDADTLAQNFKDKLSAAGDSIRGLFTQENLDVSRIYARSPTTNNPS